MRFLNYVINLVNQEDEGSKEEKASLADSFTEDMETLFRKVESEDEVKRMKNFDEEKQEKSERPDMSEKSEKQGK